MLRSLVVLSLSLAIPALAQSKKDDIPVEQLPAEVKSVLEAYVKGLRDAADLEGAEKALVPLAGGGLVNEDGKSLRGTVAPFSLKKDHQNVKHYADPIVITRVNKSQSNGDGFGPSAIKGPKYKIWIGKKEGSPGMPAPISILVPEGHESIKTPKVVGIGSL